MKSVFSNDTSFDLTIHDYLDTCIDSGAQNSVFGRKEARAYLREPDNKAFWPESSRESVKRFRFGALEQRYERFFHLRPPLVNEIVVIFKTGVILRNIPLLPDFKTLPAR